MYFVTISELVHTLEHIDNHLCDDGRMWFRHFFSVFCELFYLCDGDSHLKSILLDEFQNLLIEMDLLENDWR